MTTEFKPGDFVQLKKGERSMSSIGDAVCIIYDKRPIYLYDCVVVPAPGHKFEGGRQEYNMNTCRLQPASVEVRQLVSYTLLGEADV